MLVQHTDVPNRGVVLEKEREERAHGLTGPKTHDTLQRRTALPSKKIFLPRYLGKNIFSPLQNRYPQNR